MLDVVATKIDSLNGEELGIYSAGTAAWFDQHISMGGRLLLKYGSPSRFLHANNLGTNTVTTDQTGAELQDELFYPWGQDWTRAGQPYVMHFGGMHQLQDAGLFPTPNRDFTPSLGRWMTPDPLGGDVTNPQSLNRYAYVLNSPATLTDPLGLYNPFECDPVDPIDCGPPSCYFGDPGDCPPCDPVFGCPPPPPGGGGRGGHGGGGGGGGAPAPPSAPPAGQPPLRGGSYVGGASAGTAGQDVIDLTRWGPLWNVLVRACGSCAQVLEQAAGAAGSVASGLGVLAGLISNPTVLNAPEATWQPPKAVPVAPTQPRTGEASRFHFEVCTNVGETLDPLDPSLKVCHYQCPSGRAETRVQEAWRRCEPSVVFGP